MSLSLEERMTKRPNYLELLNTRSATRSGREVKPNRKYINKVEAVSDKSDESDDVEMIENKCKRAIIEDNEDVQFVDAKILKLSKTIRDGTLQETN